MVEIVLEELSRSFGKKRAVDALSFRVAPGELFGFLGPNGSGKSTTIKMLTTLLPPTSGDARVGGVSIRDVWKVRAKIGVVFQDPSLDTRLSALENLDFYASLYRRDLSRHQRHEKALEVLETMGLRERAEELTRTYSWGMRRRVEIARSLMTDPGLLFLDEPTTGLDPQTRAAMWEHLKSLQGRTGLTLFLATHDMEEAARCDRIAVIHEGRLQALDTPAGLMAQTGTPDLGAAFLALTTHRVRDDKVDGPLLIKGKDSSLFRRGS
jgi:ABC-2 type transport system ATP-binding protein